MLVDNAPQCLPLYLEQIFPPVIWIFTEGEGDGIKSRLPFKIFSTLTKWFNYSWIMFFFRQVHNDYKNGRQNRFDQIKKIFYYKSNLIWSNQGKGLTMETFHKDDGYSLHTLESNLKLDTQVLFMSLPSNSNHEIYWYFLIVKSMVSLKSKKNTH